VHLKDICNFEKGAVGLAKAIPGEYPLVTTGAERRTCESFQFDTKAVCIPLVSSTGHGHASLKNVHYQEGKFALGTILVALTAKDDNELDIQFLHLYLSQLKDIILVPLMSGAANVALSVTKIKSIEIPLPPVERQSEIVQQFKCIVIEEDELKVELTHQTVLLKKLRQQILQEAIEGKLTADWRADKVNGKARESTLGQNPDVEPASELLVRIKAEKEQLIKDKKIKKQKALPPITDEEKPFDLPSSWQCCYFENVANLKSGNQYKYSQSNNGVMFVKVGDMNTDENSFEITTSSIYFESDKVKQGDLIPCGSIIFPKRGGAIATNKRRVVLNVPILVDSNTMAATPSKLINFSYFKLWFDNIDLASLGNEAVVPQVNNKDIYPLIFSLPPSVEQKIIVAKVERLLDICDQLEAQITSNKSHAEQLMQAVLKEAFQQNSNDELAGVEV
jgi:type I restriction enzyme S subunit